MGIQVLNNPIREGTDDPQRVPDKQEPLSQENLQDLRSEYFPIGIVVDKLPDPSEVRDWTTAVIHSKDASGIDTITIFLMTGGKWFHLNEYQEKSTGAYGGADQFDTATVVTFTGSNVIMELTANWTAEQLSHMSFSGGVFTIEKAGNYKICWSMSFASSGNNKDYECGVVKDFITGQTESDQLNQGWAHRKIGASTDLGDMSAYTILQLKIGDKISLGMVNEDDTTTAIIDHMSFTIFRIR